MLTTSISLDEASKSCDQILQSESSVYYLSLIDNLGEEIYAALNRSLPEEVLRIETPSRVKRVYGSQVAIISNIGRMAETLLGESEFILLAYRSQKLLIIPRKSRDFTIMALTSYDCDARMLVPRILSVFSK